MSVKGTNKSGGALGKVLVLSDFEALASELKEWRKPELQELEKNKGSGLVLGFVKGLRMSARLIYALRKKISCHDLEVDWGHLLDPQVKLCSPECDVIIHRKGFFQEWNGSAKPVMDFKFIKCEQAVAVISCKSYARTIDAKYPGKLKPYVKEVFLFAECCHPKEYSKLQKQAKNAGYRGFWCLYTFDEDTGQALTQPSEWEAFLIAVSQTIDKACQGKKS